MSTAFESFARFCQTFFLGLTKNYHYSDNKLSQARQNFVKPVIIFFKGSKRQFAYIQIPVWAKENSSLDESKRKQTQRRRHSSILFGTTTYKAFKVRLRLFFSGFIGCCEWIGRINIFQKFIKIVCCIFKSFTTFVTSLAPTGFVGGR